MATATARSVARTPHGPRPLTDAECDARRRWLLRPITCHTIGGKSHGGSAIRHPIPREGRRIGPYPTGWPDEYHAYAIVGRWETL